MKQRLDQLLVARGVAETRTKAQAMIMAGQVSLEKGEALTKPGLQLPADAALKITPSQQYVSRGGEKLASVDAELALDFTNQVVVDVGSSTGGFTDYALQHGAAKVYCIDVGRGQLAYKLRQDSRVVVMEQTDIRTAKLPEKPAIALIYVSFISLRQVLMQVSELIRPQGLIVALVKPQFEAGKALADKNAGVIKDHTQRNQILSEFREWVSDNFEIIKEADSGLAGAKGNLERFFLLKRL